MIKDFNDKKFATKTIHGGDYDNEFGSLGIPIYQTSTFIFKDADEGARRFALEEDGFIYSRLGNPTNQAVEKNLPCLKKLKQQYHFHQEWEL